jgi:hypothetical protein
MKRLLLALLFPVACLAQNWSGILSASRAMDWSGVGATIVNRTTQCGSTIAAYTGTAATINTAISGCSAGQFVLLGSGTFTLSSGIQFGTNNVTLRGSGADVTILNISGSQSNGCHYFLNQAITLCTSGAGSSGLGVDSPDHTATWSAGYSQGTTVITLSSTTGMVAGALGTGTTLWLDQLNDASDGYPAAGDLFICASGCSNQGGGDQIGRAGRGQIEGHLVTAINGSNVTISPGLQMPNWRSGQTPGAWWNNAATVLVGAGLENFTLDYTAGNGNDGIELVNCTDCWVKGVKLVNTLSSYTGTLFGITTIQGFANTTRDSYFYGPANQSQGAVNQEYSFEEMVVSYSLRENNIFHHVRDGIIPNAPTWGNVWSYNYVDDSFYSGPGIIEHGQSGMNLAEGNDEANASADIIHGTHVMDTFFRNAHNGTQHNPGSGEPTAGFAMYSLVRFHNFIGNVLGSTAWNTYETDQAHGSSSIYEFGWQGTGSGTTVPNDANVQRTVMRWGNYDSVNAANRFVNAEVPSGITNFPNPIPGSQNLPPSFYLPTTLHANCGTGLAWWKNALNACVPFPPIGPDVSGGSVATSGGHAYKIPARVCFETMANDSAYPTSSPRIKVFTPTSCYQNDPVSSPMAAPAPVMFVGTVKQLSGSIAVQ